MENEAKAERERKREMEWVGGKDFRDGVLSVASRWRNEEEDESIHIQCGYLMGTGPSMQQSAAVPNAWEEDRFKCAKAIYGLIRFYVGLTSDGWEDAFDKELLANYEFVVGHYKPHLRYKTLHKDLILIQDLQHMIFMYIKPQDHIGFMVRGMVSSVLDD